VFWADLLLLAACYVLILPHALPGIHGLGRHHSAAPISRSG